mmetsp:Transcript_20176/g.60860  ORF Transcript_20176/g.60860 Transcript_20176/m.60860 type:complete len:491 (+) Transcript_20176:281-1753(+)
MAALSAYATAGLSASSMYTTKASRVAMQPFRSQPRNRWRMHTVAKSSAPQDNRQQARRSVQHSQKPASEAVRILQRATCRPSQAVRLTQHAQEGAESSTADPTLFERVRAATAALGIAVALAVTPLAVSPAWSADAAKVGTCLLESCQAQLAGCLTDIGCVKNLVCLNKCNGLPDESECQIRCGDQYEDSAVQTFNSCAVSQKKCVPQRVDKDVYPVPSECARDEKFDLNMFTGRWYITAGLNPLFDTFPCQEHYFGVPEPGVLYGRINWRVPKGDSGDFLQRSVVQTFKQQEDPAVLWNHGNAYLHYEDDWYILASKPDEYVMIYYIGNNDAWKGYGGATVYTRESKLPEKYIPELREAASKAGIKWDDFTITDNTCPAKPLTKNLAAVISDDVEIAEKDLEQIFTSFGKGFTLLENEIANDITGEEKEILRELADAEAYLAGIEKQYESTFLDLPPFKWFFGKKPAAGAVAAVRSGDVPGVSPDAPTT